MSFGSICRMFMRSRPCIARVDSVCRGGPDLQHSLSGMDYDSEMTRSAIEIFLAAESAWVDLYSSPPERAAVFVRLLWRTIRQRRYRNSGVSRMTFEFFSAPAVGQPGEKNSKLAETIVTTRQHPAIEESLVVG